MSATMALDLSGAVVSEHSSASTLALPAKEDLDRLADLVGQTSATSSAAAREPVGLTLGVAGLVDASATGSPRPQPRLARRPGRR